MAYDVSPLFEAYTVKGKTLRNRIVMPPMVVNRNLTERDAWRWYGRRARGGVAMVTVEATDSPRFIKELTAANLRPLVDAIHQGGALAAIQVFPGIRGQSVTPAQLSVADIEIMIEQFRKAAETCAAAGFDGIEPHGAHGYLLTKFFSPQQNQRTDDFGVTMEGRMRLALRIVNTIAPIAHQAGMLMLYRHTPVRNDYGIEESLALAKELLKAGVDVLDISPASDVSPGDRSQPFMTLGAPVIAVNQLDQLERALLTLNEKRADLVAVGRGLIADPDWANKVRDGRLDDVVACIGCNQCMADLRAGERVRCPEWGVSEP